MTATRDCIEGAQIAAGQARKNVGLSSTAFREGGIQVVFINSKLQLQQCCKLALRFPVSCTAFKVCPVQFERPENTRVNP